MRIGALEAGGTKMVLAVGDEKGNIFEQTEIKTKTPKENMPEMISYFKDRRVDALGIGTFGPVGVNPDSKSYGCILDTPKLSWRGYHLVRTFQKELNIPIGLDTDVNASCLGEMTYGCAKGIGSVLYLTVGTGIGAGIAIDGKLVHGMLHPDLGHITVERHKEDSFEGLCPYHKDCLEGMASGPAIEKRWGRKAYELTDNEKVWEIESYYLARALSNSILSLSPQIIILGGGVMKQAQLFPLIRAKVTEMIAGYMKTPELMNMEHYIVPNSLKGNQGILGCLELGRRKVEINEK